MDYGGAQQNLFSKRDQGGKQSLGVFPPASYCLKWSRRSFLTIKKRPLATYEEVKKKAKYPTWCLPWTRGAGITNFPLYMPPSWDMCFFPVFQFFVLIARAYPISCINILIVVKLVSVVSEGLQDPVLQEGETAPQGIKSVKVWLTDAGCICPWRFSIGVFIIRIWYIYYNTCVFIIVGFLSTLVTGFQRFWAVCPKLISPISLIHFNVWFCRT